MKKTVCILLCLCMVLLLAACGKPKKNGGDSDGKGDSKEMSYSETWVLKPSIQADSITPMPLINHNDETHHYDISFGDVYVYEQDGKYGFIDSNGEFKTEAKYDSIETCSCTDNRYIVTKKAGEYYTATYKLSPSSFTEIWSAEHKCESFTGYKYYWDTDESEIRSEYFEGESHQTSDKEIFVPETAEIITGEKETGKFTVVTAGKAVGASDYTAAGVFTNGLAAMQKNGKWGYVNARGDVVIDFEYDAIRGYNALGSAPGDTPYECSEGFVTVCKGGKYGVLKADGTLVIPCQYSYLTTVHDGRAFASADGKTWGILCVDSKISDGIRPSAASTSGAETGTSETQNAYTAAQ